MKILIVDDSKAMRMIIVRTLRQAGYGDHTLVEAASGPEALGKINGGEVPDVILCDWNMPEMTGLDLLKKIKVEWPKTKLGFVTSESSDKFRAAAMQEGAAFFLCKPFTPEGLKAALSPVLG
jgi:two-component system chemotaxis response regulator CheY